MTTPSTTQTTQAAQPSLRTRRNMRLAELSTIHGDVFGILNHKLMCAPDFCAFLSERIQQEITGIYD
jgi:hypothetical protein